jgi:hypothetical protein
MAIGYNYLIRDTISEPAIYKIGISGVLDKRLKQLKDGILTAVVGIWSSPHYEDLEKQLHKLFPMKRLPQSEWFKLSEAEVIKVIASTSQQARLEFLIPKYKPTEPVLTESELFKAELKPVVRQAVKPNGSTYPVPVRSTYSGPNPVWTDYTGKTRELPSPLPEATRTAATTFQPGTTVSTYGTTPGSNSGGSILLGIGFGMIPGFNVLFSLFFTGACLSPNTKSDDFSKSMTIATVLTTVLMYCAIATSAKPLTSYQLEPAQSVSSLIK